MPTETFFNLPKEKRELIISAAMQEFAQANYNTASINQICKQSKIPKGSFYQYFSDKLDLYVYIMTLAIETKIKFFASALNELPTLPLSEQIRILFLKGVEFAKAHPLYSALGEQFSKEDYEPAKSAVIKEGDKESESFFLHMIQKAKDKGEIDRNVDSLAFSLLLQSMNTTINQYMLQQFGDASYERHEQDIRQFVDSLLVIIFNGVGSRKNKSPVEEHYEKQT